MIKLLVWNLWKKYRQNYWWT